MTNLYPFLFRPNLHSVLWGGNRLCTYKGIKESQDAIGESWEVSAVPASTNIIANGALAGMDLITAINQSPVEILGEAVNTQYHGQLPLLAKFIDANILTKTEKSYTDYIVCDESGQDIGRLCEIDPA